MADAEQDDPDTMYEGGLRYEGDYNSSDDEEGYPPFKYKGKTYTFFDDNEEVLSYKERQLIKKDFPEAGVTMFGDVTYEKALEEALKAKQAMLALEARAPIHTPSTPPPFDTIDKEYWDELQREKELYAQERRAEEAAAMRALAERRRERRPRPYGESVVDEVFAKLTI